MKLGEIWIRDPFVLTHDGKYYLYGTTAKGTLQTNGPTYFNVYQSADLVNFDKPAVVFEKYEGFWGDYNYWAPEVHFFKGKFYMIASFKSDTHCRGSQIFCADSPLGPFLPIGDGTAVTPHNWECLDGTLYIENDIPYLVFCREWLQVKDGEIWAQQLSEDLSKTEGEPQLLFKCSEASWAREDYFGDTFVTDGPFLHRNSKGELLMLWSTFTKGHYCVGISKSKKGGILSKWEHSYLLYDRDGGHAMLFKDLGGNLKIAMHGPNQSGFERPLIMSVEDVHGKLCAHDRTAKRKLNFDNNETFDCYMPSAEPNFHGDLGFDLTVYECGYEKCSPLHFWGPAIKQFHTIHYIIKGKGKLIINENEYKLSAGDLFYTPNDCVVYYISDVDEPMEYRWVGFVGIKVKGILKRTVISAENPVHRLANSKDVLSLLENIYISSKSDIAPNLLATGNLHLFLAWIVKTFEDKK